MNNITAIKERYSEADLIEFKMLIQGKLSKSKEEYFFYMNQLTDLSANGDTKIRSLDDGSGVSENEFIASAAARLQKHIQHLENAMLRIENKVYGVCRATGKLIPKERLRAVPHATLSIEAKMNNLG